LRHFFRVRVDLLFNKVPLNMNDVLQHGYILRFSPAGKQHGVILASKADGDDAFVVFISPDAVTPEPS
jgi:hypothetical protein